MKILIRMIRINDNNDDDNNKNDNTQISCS